MGYQKGGLPDEQAFFRLRQIDSRFSGTAGLWAEHLIFATLHDPLIIFARNQSIEGELEPAPSFDTAMTVAVIASAFGQDLFHVGLKIDGLLRLGRQPGTSEPEQRNEHDPCVPHNIISA